MSINAESSERWIAIEPSVEDFEYHPFTELNETALTGGDAAIATAVQAKSPPESREIEPIDPAAEDAYWRENYRGRPYYRARRFYFDYQPAYRYGWESASRDRFRYKKFDEIEDNLAKGWADTGLHWRDWREVVRDGWNHARHEL